MNEKLQHQRRPEYSLSEAENLAKRFREQSKESDELWDNQLALQAIERYQEAASGYQIEGAPPSKLFECYRNIFTLAHEAFIQSTKEKEEVFLGHLNASYQEMDGLVKKMHHEAKRSPYAGSRQIAAMLEETFQATIWPVMKEIKEGRIPKLGQ